jgi:hypothetical protein
VAGYQRASFSPRTALQPSTPAGPSPPPIPHGVSQAGGSRGGVRGARRVAAVVPCGTSNCRARGGLTSPPLPLPRPHALAASQARHGRPGRAQGRPQAAEAHRGCVPGAHLRACLGRALASNRSGTRSQRGGWAQPTAPHRSRLALALRVTRRVCLSLLTLPRLPPARHTTTPQPTRRRSRSAPTSSRRSSPSTAPSPRRPPPTGVRGASLGRRSDCHRGAS